MPREIVAGRDNEPYAQKTELGWGVIGNVSRSRRDLEENKRELAHVTHRTVTRSVSDFNVFDSKTCYFTLRTTAKELINPVQVRQMMESDFSERKSAEQPMSLDDKKFMQKMKQGIRQGKDGQYEMPLLFRDEEPRMSNNRSVAMHRLVKLKSRLENDEQYRNDYVAFMNDLIEKKYAERVPEQQLPTNRVQQIREYTSPSQWHYIESKANPADDASRGLSAQDLISDPRWLSGPDFLWKAKIDRTQVEVPRLCENDPEVRKVRSLATQATAAEMRTIPQRLEYFSDWHHAKRAIAVCRKFLKHLKGTRKFRTESTKDTYPVLATAKCERVTPS